MLYRSCLFALLFAVTAAAQDDVASLVRQLHREKDDAELEIVERIGRARSREAAEGLVEAFDKCSTLLFRRQIAKTLVWFANLPDSQQPALQKLVDIAGSTEEQELREIALRGLGESSTLGKQFLRRIIASKASDELRVPAMRRHVKLANAADADWYAELWNLERKQRKDEQGEILPPEHNDIRQLAFEGLLPNLEEKQLIEAIKRDYDPKIRRRALDFMDRQSMPKTASIAEWMLDRVDFPGADRAAAARIVKQNKGAKALAKFVKLAKKENVTTEDLRLEMARLISQLDDKSSKKRAAKLLNKGKPHEKVFALHATVKNNDPKVLVAVRKGLKDKSVAVRRAAAQALGARRDRESVPMLRELLASKQPADVRAALEAINDIEGPMSAWLRELSGMASHEDRDVRNAALYVLAKSRDKRQIEAMLRAADHDDWSTRMAAIDGLAAVKQVAGVEKLIERIGKETGRMRRRVADALWQLTAQPFDEDVAKWQGWWDSAKTGFKIATRKQLDAAEKAREMRRLTQRTTSKAKFFGIKVESHRVIFVLDVSGSMIESMYGREVDGRGAARIDIAKLELKKAIENLEPGALFNVMIFSSGVDRWQKSGIGVNTQQDREAALTWVERLGASGGTNLYDAVREAMGDADVDTIFVLSDGVPTTGEVIDPHRIRLDIARWNRHRRIKINTIAIGGNLEVLEWLAQDSGGSYRQLR